jgi:hypothetical protein
LRCDRTGRSAIPPGGAVHNHATRGDSQGLREPLPTNGNRDVCVNWQQVSVGKHRAGARCDVLVTDQLLQFWIGEELMKTVTRTGGREVRKKHAQGSRPGSNL